MKLEQLDEVKTFEEDEDVEFKMWVGRGTKGRKALHRRSC